MYVRELFKPGQTVMPVPLGIPVTLQYDERGVFEKVYSGYQESKVDISDKIYDTLYQSETIPNSIPIKSGTTWVSGVLYTDKEFYTPGYLPDIIFPELVEYYKEHPTEFNFFAGNVYSLASVFKGAVSIKQWLGLARFHVLPSWIIPSNCGKESICNLFNSEMFPFKYPKIMYYIVYDESGVRFVHTGLTQGIVDSIDVYTDPYGDVKAAIYDQASHTTTYVDYGQLVHMDIQKHDCFVLDTDKKIIYVTPTSKRKRKVYEDYFTCTWCGKIVQISSDTELTCDDVHCLSRMHPDIEHFLSVLGLPYLTFEQYKKLVAQKEITCFTDVMLLPEYQDVKLHITLSTLLKAIIPISCIRDNSVIEKVCNHCNNNRDTLHYYMLHPQSIKTELGLSGASIDLLITWFSDAINIQSVETLMYSDNFKFDDTVKKFDGPPIFRGRTITLTGKFKRGSMEEISNILRSYAATVTYKFSDNTNCVIVGDLHEDTNSIIIHDAEYNNVPVFEETQFFTLYEIDEDLQANLMI